MKRFVYTLFGIMLFGLFSVSAQQDVYWTDGGGDSEWLNALNWSPAQTPSATDTAVFDSPLSISVILPGTTSVAGVKITTGTIMILQPQGGNRTLQTDRFLIEPMGELSISGTNNLSIEIMQHADIFGILNFVDATHVIKTSAPNKIIFRASSQFLAGNGYTGFPFNTLAENSGTVVFEDAATYVHDGGFSPFGNGSVSPVCEFYPYSYYFIPSGNPDVKLAGYTFGEVAVSITPLTVNSASSANKTFRFRKLIADATFTFVGNLFDEIVVGDTIFAGAAVTLQSGETGIRFEAPTTTVYGGNSTRFKFSNSSGSTYTILPDGNNLILQSDLTFLESGANVTVQIDGHVDFGNSQIQRNNADIVFAASSELTTANNLGFAGSLPVSAGNISDNDGMKLVYNGTAPQTAGTIVFSSAQFRELVVNCPELTLDKNITVTDNLSLDNGLLRLYDFNLSLANSTVTMHDPVLSWVLTDSDGKLTQNCPVGAPTLFPVGTASYYTPAEITSATAGNYSVRTFPNQLSGGLSGTALTNIDILNQSWEVQNPGGASFDLTVFWHPDLEAASFNQSAAYISWFNSGTWFSNTAASVGTISSLNFLSQGGFSQSTAYSVKSISNLLPTGMDASTDIPTDAIYLFSELDFPYFDPDSDPMANIQITSLPALGTLWLDNILTNDIPDAGEFVSNNQIIPIADLTANVLKYQPNAGETGNPYASFQFKVGDGTSFSALPYTMTINVTSNNPPTTTDGSFTTSYQTEFFFTTTEISYNDIDSDPLSAIRITYPPVFGHLFRDDGDGIYQVVEEIVVFPYDMPATDFFAGKFGFYPGAGMSGNTSFGFKVSDGVSISDEYVIYATVLPGNNAPFSADATVSTMQDAIYVFSEIDFPFSDADSDPLAEIQIASLLGNGTLWLDLNDDDLTDAGENIVLSQTISIANIQAGKLKYAPAAGMNGSPLSSFLFKVGDGIDFSTYEYAMSINVTPSNTPPTSNNNAVNTPYETVYTFTITDFPFADIDAGDVLQEIKILTLPSLGILFTDDDLSGNYNAGEEVYLNDIINASAEISAGKLKFIPDIGFSGTELFTFQVSDGTDYSLDTYTATINVSPAVNTPPTASNFSVTTPFETNYIFSESEFHFADVDAGDVFTLLKINNLPANGTLFLDSDNSGSFTAEENIGFGQQISMTNTINSNVIYQPNAGFSGADNFQFSVSDGTDYSTDTYTATINVSPAVNTPPTASNFSITTAFETNYTFSESEFHFADIDAGDVFTLLKISNLPANGTLFLDNDNSGSFTAGENIGIGQQIDVSNLINSRLIYHPNAGFSGADNFQFSVSDGTEFSPNYTTTLNVLSAVNGQPSSADFNIVTDFETEYIFQISAFQFFDTDATDVLTFVKITTLPTNGILYTDNDNSGSYSGASENISLMQELISADISAGKLRYKPSSGFSGNDLIKFGVSDGHEYGLFNYTISITVNSTGNTPPTAVGTTVETQKNVPYTFNLSDFGYSDSDNDLLVFLKVTINTTKGKLFIDNNLNNIPDITETNIFNTDIEANLIAVSKLKYMPDTDLNGVPLDGFEYFVSDGTDYSVNPATMKINVLGNTPPVAVNQVFTINSDYLSGDDVGSLYAEDPDGDSFYFTVLQGNTDAFLIDSRGAITVNDASLLTNSNEFIFKIEVADDGTPIEKTVFDLQINVEQKAPELVFTNYFSPNGDGHNDTWQIGGDLSLIDGATLEIYDTNGLVVYKSIGYDNTWDGKNVAGKNLPAGVYYYLIKYESTDFRGAITLGR